MELCAKCVSVLSWADIEGQELLPCVGKIGNFKYDDLLVQDSPIKRAILHDTQPNLLACIKMYKILCFLFSNSSAKLPGKSLIFLILKQ